MTIKNPMARLAEALKRCKGASLDQAGVERPEQEFGSEDVRSNGLGRLAGGWSEDEFREFERAIAHCEEVD